MLAVNLLPWREQRRNGGVRRLQYLLLGAVLIVVLATAFMDYLARQEQNRHRLEHASLQQSIDSLDSRFAQAARQRQERDQLVLQLQVLEHLQGKRSHLVDLLQRIERSVPEGAHLTALTQQGARLHVHGLAQSGSLLAPLLRNFSSALGAVELHQVKAVDEGEAFELSVTLRSEP